MNPGAGPSTGLVATILAGLIPAFGYTAPLELESKIAIGEVRGRIDHLAFDPHRQWLFIAELGNDTVGIVDVRENKFLRRLTGLREPQGICFVPSTDTLYVASGGDGSVWLFQGDELTPLAKISLGVDADNVRVDDSGRFVLVGYGAGSLALLDTIRRAKVGDIALKAHPEAFQLEPGSGRVFVNVPEAGQIAVVDRTAAKQVTGWATGTLKANFPMALDAEHGRILVVFRRPATLGAFATADGHLLSSLETCGDCDDLYIDAKRKRVYIVCGEGFVDVLAQEQDGYVRIGRVPTSPGARTGLFVGALDRLFVAARATERAPASLWVFRPQD